jgi:hypothetical protein
VGPNDIPGQSDLDVKDFLKRVLPKAEVFVTREDGHIQFITLLNDQIRNEWDLSIQVSL